MTDDPIPDKTKAAALRETARKWRDDPDFVCWCSCATPRAVSPMDRDDLIERAAWVIWETTTKTGDSTISVAGAKIAATALVCAGVLADPLTRQGIDTYMSALAVERQERAKTQAERDDLAQTVRQIEVALAEHGFHTDEPLPEQIETLAAAYRDVWRWWEKDQKDHERLREAQAKRYELAQTVQRVRDLCDPTRGGLVLDPGTRARILAILDERGES